MYWILAFPNRKAAGNDNLCQSYEPEPIKAFFFFSSFFFFPQSYFQAFLSAVPFARSQGRGTKMRPDANLNFKAGF